MRVASPTHSNAQRCTAPRETHAAGHCNPSPYEEALEWTAAANAAEGDHHRLRYVSIVHMNVGLLRAFCELGPPASEQESAGKRLDLRCALASQLVLLQTIGACDQLLYFRRILWIHRLTIFLQIRRNRLAPLDALSCELQLRDYP